MTNKHLDLYMESATFPKGGKPGKADLYRTLQEMLERALKAQKSGEDYEPVRVRVQAPSGWGKTKMVENLCTELDCRYVPIPAPVADPSDFGMTLPTEIGDGAEKREALKQIIHNELQTEYTDEGEPKPFLIVIDEISRAAHHVQGQLLELTQSISVAGQKLEGCIGVVLTDNDVADGISGDLSTALATRLTTLVGTVPKSGLRMQAALKPVPTEFNTNSFPTKEALAAMFPETNLTRFFDALSVYRRDPNLAESLTPRIMEKWVRLALTETDLPFEVTLPIVDGKRAWLFDSSEKNVTDTILGEVEAALNATSSGKPTLKALVEAAVETGKPALCYGPPGIGKTGATKSYLLDMGFHPEDILMFSGSQLNPERLQAIFVSEKDDEGPVIRTFLAEQLERPAANPDMGKVILFDEANRITADVMNQVLPITGEYALAGQPIVDLTTVIALANPATDLMGSHEVNPLDRAFADRFYFTVELGEDAIEWRSYLQKKYGESFENIIKWWDNTLDSTQRAFVPPRVLELMLNLHEGEHDPAMAIPRGLDPDTGREGWLGDIPIRSLREALNGDEQLALIDTVTTHYDEFWKELSSDSGRSDHHALFADLLARSSEEQFKAAVSDPNEGNFLRLLSKLGQDYLTQVTMEFQASRSEQWRQVLVKLGEMKTANVA